MESGISMEDRVWHPSLSKSQREVIYSCGTCGFALKLNSSDRLLPSGATKHASFNRRKILVFVRVDVSRFKLEDETSYCWSWSWSWRNFNYLHRETSRLRCGKCGTHIGWLKESPLDPSKRYCVKITKVLPEQDQDIATSSRGELSWSEDHQSSSSTSPDSERYRKNFSLATKTVPCERDLSL